MQNKKTNQDGKATKVLELLQFFDAKKENPDQEQICQIVSRCVSRGKPLQLLQFTCSTIEAKYLYSATPELYVSLSPDGNNLSPDLERYAEVVKKIVAEGAEVRSIIIIGNTDPYYIYTEQGKVLQDISPKLVLERYASRWKQYKQNLEAWLQKTCPSVNFEVLSWFELEQEQRGFEEEFNTTLARIETLFDASDFEWELRKLSTCFGAGKYFNGLEKPATAVLQRWILRKFTEYALQGLWLKRLFPEGLLVQNEKPSDLRYKMYQPLVRADYGTTLPNLYLYGVDNVSYQ